MTRTTTTSTKWPSIVIIALALVALTTLMTGASAAQGRAEGSIAGTVTDETKGVLPGVTVTAPAGTLLDRLRGVVVVLRFWRLRFALSRAFASDG